MNNIKNYFSTPLSLMSKNHLNSEIDDENSENNQYISAQSFTIIQSCLSKTIIEDYPINKLKRSQENQQSNWKDSFKWL
ncbi:unnamed protein product [Paramecium pentaurelia]|uniref:Uncharacterized protein n=1 Tax=Paramecium pentaurelia TaxID=43138 RepID=A0A8S1YL81_9CILI|nr:unnamed protein product [Paramecium pentaurelia]